MTRVPKNKGSYTFTKSGTYQVKYPTGFSEATRRYGEYRETVPTEAEAIALLKEINDFVYHGGKPHEVEGWRKGAKAKGEAELLTVAQFARDFIDLREKKKDVQPRTIDTDRECYARIDPYIGGLRLVDVSAHDIEVAYAKMRSDCTDNVRGKAYSGTTVAKTHAFLKMLFAKAVDFKYRSDNPCDKVAKPRRDTAERRSLTLRQANALFEAIAVKEPLEAKSVGVLLALMCGLRESELLALSWRDFRKGAFDISKSLVKDRQCFKDTKNHENRVVPCPAALMGVLEQWRKKQRTLFSEAGLDWGPDTPIVNSRKGNHTLQRVFIHYFERKRLEWPIPDDFKIHELRHTFTSLMAGECRVDTRTAKSLTGHKSDQAFSIYTHTTDERAVRAINDYGDLIAPETGEMRCCNCRFWAASPVDATKGSCWADQGVGPVTMELATKCPNRLFIRKVSKGVA